MEEEVEDFVEDVEDFVEDVEEEVEEGGDDDWWQQCLDRDHFVFTLLLTWIIITGLKWNLVNCEILNGFLYNGNDFGISK